MWKCMRYAAALALIVSVPSLANEPAKKTAHRSAKECFEHTASLKDSEVVHVTLTNPRGGRTIKSTATSGDKQTQCVKIETVSGLPTYLIVRDAE